MEIEKSLISALDCSDNVRLAWEEQILPEHFYRPDTRGVFEFILKYWMDSDRKLAPTGQVIKEEFPAFEIIEPEESLPWMIDKIKQKYRRTNIKALNQKVAELNIDGDDELALKTLLSDGFALSQSLIDRRSRADLFEEDNIDSRRERYTERTKHSYGIRGARLGFDEIDMHLNGLLPGELAAMAGYAGTGKSWALGRSAIKSMAIGLKPYLVTLEIPKDDFEDRLDAIASGISYGRLLRGNLTLEEQNHLKGVQDGLRDDKASLIVDSPPQGQRTVAHLITKAFEADADYLLIDQLSFIEARRNHSSTRDRYGEIMNDLKVAISGHSKKMPCLVATQMNRASTKEKNRGDMSNIAESVFIEQVVDHAFGLTQTNEARANNTMYFDIMKCRRSEPKSWMLDWNLTEETHFGVFQEITKED